MADVRLEKPAKGQRSIIQHSGDDTSKIRFAFDFPIKDAFMDRVDANLVLSFEDGSEIVLEKFYSEHDSDFMPIFEIDRQIFVGANFFNTFDEDLTPDVGNSDGDMYFMDYTMYGSYVADRVYSSYVTHRSYVVDGDDATCGTDDDDESIGELGDAILYSGVDNDYAYRGGECEVKYG